MSSTLVGSQRQAAAQNAGQRIRLAMQVESQRGNETRNILLISASRRSTSQQYKSAWIDAAAIDALVLSTDTRTTWRPRRFLAGAPWQAKAKLRCCRREGCFCAREWTAPPVRGASRHRPQSAREADVAVTTAERPALVAITP